MRTCCMLWHRMGERRRFASLIKVSGVGPKSRWRCSRASSVEGFRHCVQNQDVAALHALVTTAIGRKTAERLLVEMRDRLTRRRGLRVHRALRPPRPGGRGLRCPGRVGVQAARGHPLAECRAVPVPTVHRGLIRAGAAGRGAATVEVAEVGSRANSQAPVAQPRGTSAGDPARAGWLSTSARPL